MGTSTGTLSDLLESSLRNPNLRTVECLLEFSGVLANSTRRPCSRIVFVGSARATFA